MNNEQAVSVSKAVPIPSVLQSVPGKSMTNPYIDHNYNMAGYTIPESLCEDGISKDFSNNAVLCSSSKRHSRHEGNIKFKDVVRLHVDAYHHAHSKKEKSQIIVHIADELLQNDTRFLSTNHLRRKVCF